MVLQGLFIPPLIMKQRERERDRRRHSRGPCIFHVIGNGTGIDILLGGPLTLSVVRVFDVLIPFFITRLFLVGL